MDGYQADAICDILAEGPGGKWASFEAAVVGPRQSTGKGAILEAIELGALFLLYDELTLHSAHEFKTAQEGFSRLLQRVESTPELYAKVARVRTSHGEEGIEVFGPGRERLRIRFVARSTGSGRGFTGDRIILDEAYNLTDKAMSALLPTMAAKSKTGNPQIIYTSSAPLPESCSDVLRRVMRRGRDGDTGLVYIEFSADPAADLDDREAWAEANPSLGVRITEEFIELERRAMLDEDFARERLGIFPDLDGGAWAVISEAKWEACGADRLTLADPVTFAVDVTPDRSDAAIAASDGKSGEVNDHRPRTKWVIDRLVQLCADHANRGVWVDSKSEAVALVDDLEAAGVTVRTTSTDEYQQACADFVDEGVTERGFCHGRQPALTAAVAGATKRFSGERWMWDRRSGTDISPLVAVTLARYGGLRPAPAMALPEVVVL